MCLCVCEGSDVSECICVPACDAGPTRVDTVSRLRWGPSLAARGWMYSWV